MGGARGSPAIDGLPPHRPDGGGGDGVDLGWMLWQSIEIQHAADSGALAGVAYEPDLRTEAHTEAVAAATENGFDNTEPGTTVSVIDFEDDNTYDCITHDDYRDNVNPSTQIASAGISTA